MYINKEQRLTFLEVAHMVDGTALIGWGGVGMLTFLEVAHMVDATALIGWGGVGSSFFISSVI